MIYYLDVTLTQSGVDWAHEVPIPASMSEAEYNALASRTVFLRNGYTIDVSEGTTDGFAYSDIVGRTVNQIRGLFPDENGEYDHTYARVHVSGSGDFTVIGSSSGEDLFGGAGNDRLFDGGNAGFEYEFDSLAGGLGDDTYCLTGVDSSVLEKPREGYDRIYAEGFVLLPAGSEIEFTKVSGDYAQVYGNELGTTIVGSDQSTLISAMAGNDVLRSGGGDTVFDGGAGNDIIQGGAGVDVILYHGIEQGRDTITRFGNEDVLVTT